MNMTRWRGLSPLLGIGLAVFVGLACLSTNVRGDVITYYDSTNLIAANVIGVTNTPPEGANTGTGVQSLTLQQLETVAAGGSGYAITINNGYDTKVFEAFTGYSSAGTGGASGVLDSAISVKGAGSGDSLTPLGPGLTFQGLWQAGTGQTQDTRFDYNVSILQPSSYGISDIGLQMGAAYVALGGNITIIESVVSPLTATETYQMNTTGSQAGLAFNMALVNPVSSGITVQKDISLTGGSGPIATSITDFNQTFSESVVPEPSSMAIAGLGALGMIGYGLRRRKTLGA